MFEQVASRDGADSQDAVGFLAAATKALAKLPSQLWRTGNERSAASAAGLDALAVQLDCARVGQAESRAVVDQPPAPTEPDHGRSRLRWHGHGPQGDDRAGPARRPRARPGPRRA